MNKLIRVRFICHGVPANKFFTEYKHYEEKRYKAKMIHFDFRPKNKGWRNSDWLMEFANGKSNKGAFTDYYYYYYYYNFQLNALLRKSCYTCKSIWHEKTDFTIADFWGIYKYRPENKDQEGISLLLAHTPIAQDFISQISNFCVIEELPMSAVDYIYQDAANKMQLLELRNEQMQKVLKFGYMKVMKDYLKKKILKHKLYGLILYIKHKVIG